MNKEAVNHPDHYQSGSGIEVIDVIEAFSLGFNLGNVVKYILRAGHKGDRREDLKKAMWYLSREIGAEPGEKILTNGDLYKTPEARSEAWEEYCHSKNCSTCPLKGGGCAYRWLELAAPERVVVAKKETTTKENLGVESTCKEPLSVESVTNRNDLQDSCEQTLQGNAAKAEGGAE